MPNPFPGMDPYLEGPFWPSFHSSMMDQIARQLAVQLRPNYLVSTNERTWNFRPDEIELANYPERIRGSLSFDPTTQIFIEIREHESRSTVTLIEMLLPSQKRGDGLKAFRSIRNEALNRQSHYLEIDLLRIGERFPIGNTSLLPSAPYFVFLSRADQRSRFDVWSIKLEEHLPVVPIPLQPTDFDATLDLQLSMQTIYDIFRYEFAVDHSSEPAVPLSLEQAAWAKRLLEKAGRQK